MLQNITTLIERRRVQNDRCYDAWLNVGYRHCFQMTPWVLFMALLAGSGLLRQEARAETYYLAVAGSDSNSGTASSPWKTFSFAIPKLGPGDMLMLKDGTYTFSANGRLVTKCDSGGNAKNGTSTRPIVVKARNERRAFLKGDGSNSFIRVDKCSFWVFEGLHIRSADLTVTTHASPIHVTNSSNLIWRRMLVHNNNRFQNSHLMTFVSNSNFLVEESEFYYFHRHAVLNWDSNNMTYRRNYCNSRNHADIVGGYQSESANHGEACVSIYPGSNVRIENNISEGNSMNWDVQATKKSYNNHFAGNISLNERYGAVIKARGNTEEQRPYDNVIANLVVINPKSGGVYFRGVKNARCDNCTILGGGGRGLVMDVEPNRGSPPHSGFASNLLVADKDAGYGIRITTDIQEWKVSYANCYGNQENFSPGITDSRYLNSQSTDPQLGTCRIFIPSGSPMKAAGLGGRDIGANVLYRYQDGILTTKPLWNPDTAGFTCGAIAAGVNDTPDASCYDVHMRLNVNVNGCALPHDYLQSDSVFLPPSNLTVVLE